MELPALVKHVCTVRDINNRQLGDPGGEKLQLCSLCLLTSQMGTERCQSWFEDENRGSPWRKCPVAQGDTQ